MMRPGRAARCTLLARPFQSTGATCACDLVVDLILDLIANLIANLTATPNARYSD